MNQNQKETLLRLQKDNASLEEIDLSKMERWQVKNINLMKILVQRRLQPLLALRSPKPLKPDPQQPLGEETTNLATKEQKLAKEHHIEALKRLETRIKLHKAGKPRWGTRKRREDWKDRLEYLKYLEQVEYEDLNCIR